MKGFGTHIRKVRLRLGETSNGWSLRTVAGMVQLEPSYLSKIEREIEPPPGEDTILRLAHTLNEDADVLLAMTGKVSSDLRAIICKRPKLFSNLLRQLKSMPDHAILRIARDVTDGDWETPNHDRTQR
ncbi:MAG: helix-turn-helix domain-containing protein [Coraliomargaritaceae bacterium]